MDIAKTIENYRRPISHLLNTAYVLLSAWYFLTIEYADGNYFYYRFTPYHRLLSDIPTFFVLPIRFGASLAGYTLLLYFLKLGDGIKSVFRQTLLLGFGAFLYVGLLTFEADTKDGVFFFPVTLIDIPFKAIYCRAVIFACFLAFYVSIIRLPFKQKPLSGFFFPLAALCVLPFVFDNEPWWHFCLILVSALMVYFYSRLNVQLDVWRYGSGNLKTGVLLFGIFLTACVLRLWNLAFLTETGLYFDVSDGRELYENSVALWNGKPIPSPSVTPSYSCLLYLFYALFGFDIARALGVQAIVFSLTPVFVYFIGRYIFDSTTGWMAAACAAFSSHLIYYSGVSHRAGAAAFFLTLSIFILTRLDSELRLGLAFLAGFCLTWTMLLDAASAPMLLLAFIPIYGKPELKSKTVYLGLVFAGFIAAEASFNLAMLNNLNAVFPLGRQTAGVVSQWNYAGLEEGKILEAAGFDPLAKPVESLKILFAVPDAFPLYFKKSFKEFQSYFLDHQTIYLDPLFLNEETYFSKALSFYYFPVLVLGAVAVFFERKTSPRLKILLGFPTVFSLLFYAFFLLGTNRYRVVVQPLFLIIFARGISAILGFLSKRENIAPLPSRGHLFLPSSTNGPLFKNPLVNQVCLSMIVLSAMAIAALFCGISPRTNVVSQTLWADDNRLPENFLFQSKLLTKSFLAAKTGVYDLKIKVAPEFGPSKLTVKMILNLNDNYVKIAEVSRNSGFLVFKDIRLKEGYQYVAVKPMLLSYDPAIPTANEVDSGKYQDRKAVLGGKPFIIGAVKLMGIELEQSRAN